MKLTQLTLEDASRFYEVHKERSLYGELVEYMTINKDEIDELITHTRAWVHIKDFDPTLEQGIDASRIFSDEHTIAACDLAINFWEEQEEYEKCAHIKKIKDLLKENLP